MTKHHSFKSFTFLGLSCLALLQACSLIENPRSEVDPTAFFHDELFPAPKAGFTLESPTQLFLLPENYMDQLDRLVRPLDSEYERYTELRKWAFRLSSEYEFTALETVSLAELNSARKINCLSFSAMFVAAARYVDVPAEFQLVFAPPFWDKQNNSWINNQHINVTGRIPMPDLRIERPANVDQNSIPVFIGRADLSREYRYVADVNPAVVSMRVRREIISESEVASLFYSNKTIEHLLGDDLAAAYIYTTAALQSDPDSALAWNNLGVLYARVNQPQLAIAAYEQAIAADDNAHSARSNLARTVRALGDDTRALVLEKEVQRFRESNPYYHAALAEQELAAGNLIAARENLEEAIERKHNEQFFYHQLAIVSQKLGDTESVVKNLRSARRHARGTDKARFSNKLQALENLL